MDNIVECAYNMDNGYVEVWFADGNMFRIKSEEVEAALRTTEQSLAKLHKLLDEKPIEYVAMALSGEMQAYCAIEDDMVIDNDIVPAKQLGMKTIWVKQGLGSLWNITDESEKADMEINNLSDILKYL